MSPLDSHPATILSGGARPLGHEFPRFFVFRRRRHWLIHPDDPLADLALELGG